MKTSEQLLADCTAVLCRLREAERAAGRAPGSVGLVLAAKYADAGQISLLHSRLGLCDFGENRVQTFLEHWENLPERNSLRMHFIGSLQKNKVKYLIGKTELIHSVDSAELADEIEKQAAKKETVQKVLIEINSGEEQSKTGVSPDGAAALALHTASLPHTELCGFMTMGPKFGDRDAYFANFDRTARLARDIWASTLHREGTPYLSMGMTESLEPAVAAGASCVRIGRAVFGERPAQDTGAGAPETPEQK